MATSREEREEDEIDPLHEPFPAIHSTEVAETEHKPRHASPTLRLIVLKSGILPRSQRIVVMDGFAEVSVGRDVLSDPRAARLRLKEMAISKYHASIFWHRDQAAWAVVDLGSMHGTFVRSPSEADSTAIRLSPSRVASIPRVLKSQDEIKLGSTTFVVHIHKSARPCSECTVDGNNEVPLFSSSQYSHDGEKRKREEDISCSATESLALDPRKALADLKTSLLSRHPIPLGHKSRQYETTYKDRSAMRRVAFPRDLDVHFRPSANATSSQGSVTPETKPNLPPQPMLDIRNPDNVGFRLLVKQGWSVGTTLGVQSDAEEPSGDPSRDRIRLLDPLEVKYTVGKTGLGAAGPLRQNKEDYAREAKRRRWESVINEA